MELVFRFRMNRAWSTDHDDAGSERIVLGDVRNAAVRLC
jgi:hypothetical protein